MTENQIIARLIALGINEREARVYLALLKAPGSTASDLQKLSGLRQNKIYEIVGNLTRMGFCIEKRGRQARTFDPVDPSEALEQRINALECSIVEARELKDYLHSLHQSAEKASAPFDYIEIVHGILNVHHKYIEYLRNTENEVLAFVRPPYACHNETLRREQDEEMDAARRRGVHFRRIIEVNEHSPEWIQAEISDDLAGDHPFRISPDLPLKLFIFDRETLLITDIDNTFESGNIATTVIKQETTVKGYATLYDHIWNHSLSYEQWLVEQSDISL